MNNTRGGNYLAGTTANSNKCQFRCIVDTHKLEQFNLNVHYKNISLNSVSGRFLTTLIGIGCHQKYNLIHDQNDRGYPL